LYIETDVYNSLNVSSLDNIFTYDRSGRCQHTKRTITNCKAKLNNY